jgi:hypothetical protein
MYRDLAQWTSIRSRVLRKGALIRQVVRETGISRQTVRKMLNPRRCSICFQPRSSKSFGRRTGHR